MNDKRKLRALQLMSGRRVAEKDVKCVVIEYVPGAQMRGSYDPATSLLSIYRMKIDKSRILLMIRTTNQRKD